MGHYYAYIKPHIEDKESEEWLEFNDFTVRPIIKEEAFELFYLKLQTAQFLNLYKINYLNILNDTFRELKIN